MITKNLVQGSPEWVEFRKNGVGSSDIASIVNAEGSFQNREEVMLSKLGFEKPLTDFQKKLFNEGHEWETVVRDRLNEQGFNFAPCVAVGEEGMFASLDGADVSKEMLLEVKSCSSKERFAEYCEKIPEHYNAQMQWAMFITGYTKTMFAIVHDGELNVRVVEANKEVQLKLESAAKDFLRDLAGIRSGMMPMPVKEVYNSDVERLIGLKYGAVELGKRLDEIESEIKAISERLLTENNALQLTSPHITIQWVEREGSVDYKKIPELEKIDLSKYRKRGSRFIKVTLK